MKRSVLFLINLFILTLTLSGCSMGRTIDMSTDYNSNLKDGLYEVSSLYADSFGYRKKLKIGVHDGIISDVSYEEINANGQNRNSLPISAQRWANCNESYSQIVSELYEETILSQGKKVDTVSGATKTINDYVELMEAAELAAEEGTPSQQSINTFNDVYSVQNQVDPITGSQEQMNVTVVNGQITSVEIKEVTNNAAFYAIGKSYESLAEISTRLKSLENVNSISVDPQIVNRYNGLLEQVRNLRETK